MGSIFKFSKSSTHYMTFNIPEFLDCSHYVTVVSRFLTEVRTTLNMIKLTNTAVHPVILKIVVEEAWFGKMFLTLDSLFRKENWLVFYLHYNAHYQESCHKQFLIEELLLCSLSCSHMDDKLESAVRDRS